MGFLLPHPHPLFLLFSSVMMGGSLTIRAAEFQASCHSVVVLICPLMAYKELLFGFLSISLPYKKDAPLVFFFPFILLLFRLWAA